ncbi:hypothetical protein ACFLS1_04735 [Verrucomicrobiota bacterium]
MAKKKKNYNLREGMTLEKVYYGKTYSLLVVRHNGDLQFKLGDCIFKSLTAAARHVCGNETQQISGPMFWGIHAK